MATLLLDALQSRVQAVLDNTRAQRVKEQPLLEFVLPAAKYKIDFRLEEKILDLVSNLRAENIDIVLLQFAAISITSAAEGEKYVISLLQGAICRQRSCVSPVRSTGSRTHGKRAMAWLRKNGLGRSGKISPLGCSGPERLSQNSNRTQSSGQSESSCSSGAYGCLLCMEEGAVGPCGHLFAEDCF